MLAFNSTFLKLNCIAFCLFMALSLAPTAGHSQNQNSNSFIPDLYNIENTTNETFRYKATLKNNGNQPIRYSLSATIPEGWRSTFKARGNGITTIGLDANKTENITIELVPAYNCQPDSYQVPITAISESDTLQFQLEAVVKGSYELDLTTPSGLLSGRVTEGENFTVTLKVKNTGSLPLRDLELSSRNPSKWTISFDPASIDLLDAGKAKEVTATISVPDKSLPGDYLSKITVKNSETSSTMDYRVTVKTSALAGWVGVLTILASVAIVFFLIRKFGRR